MPSELFRDIHILPRRLILEGPGSRFSLYRLRGVWGMVLKRLSREAYTEVFEGRQEVGPNRPGYTLRDGGVDSAGRRVLCWTLVGRDALAHDPELLRAWQVAGAVGVERNREAYEVSAVELLGPCGAAIPPEGDLACGWHLSLAAWPLLGDATSQPCTLFFQDGLHLRETVEEAGGKKKRRMRETLTWPLILEAMRNRIEGQVDPRSLSELPALCAHWEEASSNRANVVRFEVVHLESHWSASQERLRTYQTMRGSVAFPQGLGEGWPLIMAARWLHIGRHATEGMGGFSVGQY